MSRFAKIASAGGVALGLLVLLVPEAMAQAAAATAGGAAESVGSGLAQAIEALGVDIVKATLAFAGAMTIMFAVAVGAYAQSKVAMAALEGISRNPGAGGRIFTSMILGLALIESLVIYALIVSLILALK